MAQINNIVFDLGGVLIDWNPRYLYRQIFSDPEEMEFFLSHVCHGHWNEQQDGGRDFLEACELLIPDWPQYREQIFAFYHRWPEMLNGPLEETVEVLRQYHQHTDYRVFAITNWSAQTYPIAQRQYDFLNWFEDVVVSGVEKMLKPQERIYRLLLDRNNLVAEECVFIDDNATNVQGAKAVGMQALRFTNASALKVELAELTGS